MWEPRRLTTLWASTFLFKLSVIFVLFKQNCILSTDLSKTAPVNCFENPSSACRIVSGGPADSQIGGQTDRHDEANDSFTKIPVQRLCTYFLIQKHYMPEDATYGV
jgi:hypothetical protein